MVDWARAERLYREGELSIREIARREGVSEGAVRKRAKAQAWKRANARSETSTGFLTDSGSEEAEPAETPTGFAIHHAADAGSPLSFVLPIESSRRCRVS